VVAQRIRRHRGVIVDESGGDHAAEPLADIAFVEAGGVGDLMARRWWQDGECVEQSRPMPDAGEDDDGAVVHDLQDPLCKVGRYGERADARVGRATGVDAGQVFVYECHITVPCSAPWGTDMHPCGDIRDEASPVASAESCN